jgi:hypothetical protein
MNDTNNLITFVIYHKINYWNSVLVTNSKLIIPAISGQILRQIKIKTENL